MNRRQQPETDRARRMKWFREARFGMFIHWGLYSRLGRHEWVMNRELIPIREYEKLADSWKPRRQPARAWADLAKKTGMKYLVMTAKHHEGFCLWETRQTDYHSVRRGPKRDLVREFVDACREFDLRIGLYYSLMDWHHPDGTRCARDPKARRRFLDFTQGCVRELCENYGKIDLLWYDMARPFTTPEGWESRRMNAMVRALQPEILINNRARLEEDFGTPEEQVQPAETGRVWEACMTLNGSWGYMPSAIDWVSARDVIVKMLLPAAANGGNLLLNIGPKPDGSVPAEATKRLKTIGRWIDGNGEAVYGELERVRDRMELMHTGYWTVKDRTAYYWCYRWPGRRIVLPGLKTTVKRITLLASGRPVEFEQDDTYLILKNLPETCPDKIVGVTVFRLDCASRPRQSIGRLYPSRLHKTQTIVP